MQKAKGLCIGLSVFALISVLPVHATPGDPPPTAFLERASIVAVGKNVHVTRVPTQDINGAVKYFDLEITLNVNNEGMVDTVTVISAESPQFSTQELIAGNYQDAGGNQCTLTMGVAHEGRKVVAINCISNNGVILGANLYTGPIIGHLFEQELLAAGIDQIPGHENLTWGKIINQQFGSFLGCYSVGYIIGANQVGNVLTVTNYGVDNFIDCGQNFTLIEP